MRLRAVVVALTLGCAGGAFAQPAPGPGPDRPPPLRRVCMADVQKLCPDAQPGHGGVGMCLRAHRDEVSPDCRSAMAVAREWRQSHRRAAGPDQPDAPPPPPPPPSSPQ